MSNLSKDLAKLQEGNQGQIFSMMVGNRLDKLFIEDRDNENRYGLHASAIIAPDGEFCYREQVLSLFFKQNQGHQLPVKTLRIFAQGNATHEKWYQLFRRQKIDIAIERTLFIEKYDLNFTIDALLNLFNEEIVVDVKSMNSFSYKKANGHHPKGEKQVMFYLWALSKYTGVPHKKGIVLCENKDNQEHFEVPVFYDKKVVIPFVERLKDIQDMKAQYLEEGLLPPKEGKDPDCKRCSKCNCRDACWNIGMGRVKLGTEH